VQAETVQSLPLPNLAKLQSESRYLSRKEGKEENKEGGNFYKETMPGHIQGISCTTEFSSGEEFS
jgi:hypothetical protein